MRVGAAGLAGADVVDERVALLDAGVDLRRVALEDAEAAAARGEVVAGRELVARRSDRSAASRCRSTGRMAPIVAAPRPLQCRLSAVPSQPSPIALARSRGVSSASLSQVADADVDVGRDARRRSAPGACVLQFEHDARAGDLRLRDAAAAGRAARHEVEELLHLGARRAFILVIELSNGKMLYICSTVTGAGDEIGADAGRVGEREVGLDAEAEPHRRGDEVAERRVAAARSSCASSRRARSRRGDRGSPASRGPARTARAATVTIGSSRHVVVDREELVLVRERPRSR